ncbi:MAG TPA: HlyD family secretion protein [Gemmatimonadales bacterium]|nr:HlyD family secretion protein [Gemmatimonadales bacterium]
MATTVERNSTSTTEDDSPLGGASITPAPEKPAGGRKRIVLIVVGLGLAFMLFTGARRFIFNLSHVTSDNAQVDGHVVPILPKVGGFVASVRVQDNTPVKAGDVLVSLDDKDYRARLQQTEADLAVALASVSSPARVGQAEAQVNQAQAAAQKAHSDLDRIQPLAAQGIVSSQQLDGAEAAARSADAALAAAQAALAGADAKVAAARAARDQAALQLSYAQVVAPVAGIVSKKNVEVGQLVQPGEPLMSVVPMDDIWVTANLKETEVADVKAGEPVDVTVDAYPGKHFSCAVNSISPATGARFSLLPPDNATGNFTKVVQRVPVRIACAQSADPTTLLRPGMSVVVVIKTK